MKAVWNASFPFPFQGTTWSSKTAITFLKFLCQRHQGVQRSTPVHLKVGALGHIKSAEMRDSKGDAHDPALLAMICEPVPQDKPVQQGRTWTHYDLLTTVVLADSGTQATVAGRSATLSTPTANITTLDVTEMSLTLSPYPTSTVVVVVPVIQATLEGTCLLGASDDDAGNTSNRKALEFQRFNQGQWELASSTAKQKKGF